VKKYYLPIFCLSMILICNGAAAENHKARELAEAELGKYLIKCGDSWYISRVVQGIRQLKGSGMLLLREKQLTEADKLNGFKYMATLEYSHLGAQRQYSFNAWDPWETSRIDIDIFIYEKDGLWKAQKSDDLFRGATYTDITVDKVLASIKQVKDLSLELLDVEVERRGEKLMKTYRRRAEIIPDIIQTYSIKSEFIKDLAPALNAAIYKETLARNNLKRFDDTPTFSEFNRKQNDLVVILSKFLALVDASPEARGNQSFIRLRIQLEGTENRIMVERSLYNEAADEFNKKRAALINESDFKDKFVIRPEGIEPPPDIF
jgi:hypothetical protein